MDCYTEYESRYKRKQNSCKDMSSLIQNELIYAEDKHFYRCLRFPTIYAVPPILLIKEYIWLLLGILINTGTYICM